VFRSLSVTRTLAALFVLLATFVLALTGNRLIEQVHAYSDSQRVTQFNLGANQLVTGLFEILMERLATNNALQAPGPANEQVVAEIAQRRTVVAENFTPGLAQLEQFHFPAKQELMEALRSAVDRADEYRGLADKAILLPKEQRPQDLVEAFIPTITASVDASLAVWFSALHSSASSDPVLVKLAVIKELGWRMRDMAGKERSFIGSSISAAAPFTPDMLRNGASYRATVDGYWKVLNELVTDDDADAPIRNAMAVAQTEYFEGFRTAADEMRAIGDAGAVYPITASEWTTKTTPQLGTLLAVLYAAAEVSEVHLQAELSGDLRDLVQSVALALAAIVVAALAFVVLHSRLTKPLKSLASSMHDIANGNFQIELRHGGRKDEIGAMVRAVETFRENGLKVVELTQAEASRTQAEDESRARMMNELQQSFGAVVNAATAGDFSTRVSTTFPDQELNTLAMSINNLVQTVDAGLGETSEVLSALADADLTQRVQGEYKGAFLKLKMDTNQVAEKLSSIVGQLRGTSTALKSATGEILTGTNDLSQRTAKQASTIEKTSAAMEQLANAVAESTKKAKEAATRTHSAARLAGEGGQVMSDATDAMERISSSSAKISNIIGIIDDIAFQTNLLALNASVEAARAGEAGKGFAVVAIEVRRLAQSAAQASSEVKVLIEQSAGEVNNGSRLVASAAGKLQSILGAVEENSGLMQGISEASMSQYSAIGEVTSAMRNMGEMTQHNAALAEQTNAALEQTEAQASELDEIVAVFRMQREHVGTPSKSAPQYTAEVVGRQQKVRMATGYHTRSNAAIQRDWSEI
jgi:methyl-accepting chemotaxis protein